MIERLQSARSWVAEHFAIEIPPHSYALLRIVLGVVGVISLIGLTPVGMYWPLDGLAPLPGEGSDVRAWIAARGLDTLAIVVGRTSLSRCAL